MAKLTLEAIKNEIIASENRVKSEIAKFKSEILKEIEDLRSDNAVLSSHTDQLADHDLRIEKLEKQTSVS